MLNVGLLKVLGTANTSACLAALARTQASRAFKSRSGVKFFSRDAFRDRRVYRLSHRALLKVEGPDTGAFLQGIITNDVALLEEPNQRLMYCHLLNVQGRTLYDVIVYSLRAADLGAGVLLECDASVTESILKHLKIYKIRRNVTLDSCPDLSLWAVLSPGEQVGEPRISSPQRVLLCEPDPRTPDLGWRLVLDQHVDPRDVLEACEEEDVEEYHRRRYRLGLPEGVKDLPPGSALPLESNLVYMQGISFRKGCYLGQELTARTHHTGVIRKRLMPVRLSAPVAGEREGAALLTAAGRPAGKLRSGVGDLGLSLVRVAHAAETLTLAPPGGDAVTLQASEPDWWPEDK